MRHIANLLCTTTALAFTAGALAQPVTRVPDTVVSATRVPTTLDRVGSAITVITAEDLQNRQTVVLTDILREIPGVAVSRTGQVGGQTSVRIRGAESRHTKVIIDGVEVNDPSAGNDFDFANLLAGDVERIEVLRGPQSVLYGSDAIGGVVRIITKKGRGAPKATAQLEGGSFQTHRALAQVRGGSEWIDYALNLQHLETGGISSADRRNGNAEQDGHRNLSGSTQLAIRPVKESDFEFGLALRRTDAKVDFDGLNLQGRPTDAPNVQESSEQFVRLTGSFSLFDGMLENQFGGSYFDKKRDTFRGGIETGRFDGYQKKFDYQGNLKINPNNTVNFGAESRTEWVNDSTTISASDDIRGAFLLYQLGLFDALYLSAGGRYDDHSRFGEEGTYRFTAAYSLRDWGTKPHASYGTGFKAPTLFQLFANFAPFFVGNPNLQPETSKGFDFGVEQTLFGGRLVLDVTLFQNDIDNLIVTSGVTLRNIAKTEARGAEFSLKAKPLTWLDLAAAYTYSLTEDANTHTQVVRRAKHIASFNATARPRDDVAVNLDVIANGNQQDFDFTVFPTVQRGLGGYTLVNFGASWQVTPWATLFARVENAFDKDYQEVLGFGTLGRGGYAGARESF
jgi:vitamin B12 transporter